MAIDYDASEYATSPHARHVQLSTSTTALSHASAPQPSFPQASLEVTTLADVVDASDGVLSLREAITAANAAPGLDTITFADAIRGGTITLTDDLPTITDSVVLDGDPLDRGAGGIVIDGGVVTPSDTGPRAFSVTNAAARFEDLTIKNGSYVAIDATAADVALERAAVIGSLSPFGCCGYGVRGDGSLAIVDSVISGTVGDFGVFPVDFVGDVSIERSTIRDSSGEFYSGVRVVGDVRVVDSTFIDNQATDIMGTLGVIGSLTLENSSFVGNGVESGRPSSVVAINGDALIVNSTFVDNASGSPNSLETKPAATILVGDDSTARIVNTTLTGTREFLAFKGGESLGIGTGLYVAPTSRVEVANSIVDDAIVGTITSNGANTFRETTVDGAVAGDRVGVAADDLFAITEAVGRSAIRTGVAADNGGPTPTVALLDDPANPALDRADPNDAPPTDQRGFARDATPDIGAFELDAGPPAPPDTLPPLAEKVSLADADIRGAPLFLVGPAGDAAIAFVDEYAAFQSSLGVYLVGPDGTIGSTAWAFERIEHSEPSDLASTAARPGGGPLAPGDAVLLSELFDPAELGPGVGFGLFLVADGWSGNPRTIFDGGTLDFRSGGGAARVTDATPQLVHIAENGVERLVLGDIMHTVDAGSPNPLSNTLNPGGTGQVTSGLLDGLFTVAFEDKPVAASDRDFNDALVAIDLLDAGDEIVAAAAPADAAGLETLLTPVETV